MASQPQWIYRRVETVSLIAERRVRREMSVDCRIPPPVIQLAGDLGLERFPVPLRFVMRRSLLSFDLRLDGLPVPLLTREQNITVTTMLLAAAVEEYGRDVDDDILAALSQVSDAGDRYGDETLALLGLDEGSPASMTPEADVLRWAITTFDANYLLMTDVPLDAARDRLIFKINQEMPAPIQVGGLVRQIRSRIAWDPMAILFDAPDVTTAGSYHFQFLAPDELTISDGGLFAQCDGVKQATPFGETVSRTAVLGLNTHTPDVPDADSYVALVEVRPAIDGLLRAGALSAAASTLLLGFAAVFSNRLEFSEVGSSTALLLVLPGVLSTFLARPGEHSTVAQALRGVRGLMLASAVIVYVAAAMLVLGLVGSALRAGWAILAAVSAIPTVALGIAVHRSRPHADLP